MSTKMKKLFPAAMLLMVLALLVPAVLTARAAGTANTYSCDISKGSVSISDSAVSFVGADGKAKTPAYAAGDTYVITGTTNANTVSVSGSANVNITLQDVSIDVHTVSDACAFSIGGTATVNLTLDGTNTLTSGANCAGLQVPSGSTLTIDGTIPGGTTGQLTATGGNNAAGIGGGGDSGTNYGGTVNIRGGTVTAIGGTCGAGIGGGSAPSGGTYYRPLSGGDGGTVTISGGTVTATGGIGGGSGNGNNSNNAFSQGSCTITGGSVFASIGPTPTNRSDGTGDTLYLTTVTAYGLAASTDVTYKVDGSATASSCKTEDSTDKLYLWLPAGNHSLLVSDNSGNKAVAALTVAANNNNVATTNDVSYGNIVIPEAGTYALKGTTTANTIAVDHAVTLSPAPVADYVNITLNNVRITQPDNGGCAFTIRELSVVDLTLSGTNTLKSGSTCAGLEVFDGAKLSIYGSDADSLAATGGPANSTYGSGAGIGSGIKVRVGYTCDSCGDINIYGGHITATGGACSINNSGSGAGIGAGGLNGNADYYGTITINGGTVIATGGACTGKNCGSGAGIGGGGTGSNSGFSSPGHVNINGGTVIATGGVYTGGNCGSGAGIGGGGSGSDSGGGGCAVQISNGTVTAAGGNAPAVTTYAPEIGCGIGGGGGVDHGSNGPVTITGGSVYVSSMGPAPTNGSVPVYLTTVTMKNPDTSNNGTPIANAPVSTLTATIGGTAYSYGAKDMLTDANGKLYMYFPATAPGAPLTLTLTTTVSPVTYVASADISDTNSNNIGLFNINGGGGWVNIASSGFYGIAGTGAQTTNSVGVAKNITGVNITINNINILAFTPFVVGYDSTVNLTLSGTNVLTSSREYAGLQFKSSGCTLNIYGGELDSLNARGGDGSAGIGGIAADPGGSNGFTVNIYGGSVTAKGGGDGAGIGGGNSGNGGNVNIYGGKVIATGGRYGAGIGGGLCGSGGIVNISGGTVTASGGKDGGAGIGGSAGRNGGIAAISGGTVTAIGTDGGAGIGGGKNAASQGSCLISGGSVLTCDTTGKTTVDIPTAQKAGMGPTAQYGNTVYYNNHTPNAYPNAVPVVVTLDGVSDVTVTCAVTTYPKTADEQTKTFSCKTDATGRLFLWLPAADMLLSATDTGGTVYQTGGTVSATNNVFTAYNMDVKASPGGGSFHTAQDVALTCADPNAAIYYTTDGITTPTSSSEKYDSAKPIHLAKSTTLKAIAIDGSVSGSVMSAIFTIVLTSDLAVSISPNGGSFSGSQTVALSCGTAGASIRYTTDGSDPTAGGTTYTAPFPLTASATVKAVASVAESTGGRFYGDISTATFTKTVPIIPQPQPPSGVAGETWKNPFKDVADGAWYYDAVQFVAQNGLMTGTQSDLFSPDMALTRGMFVTILHRLSGETGTYPNPFTDVKAGAYYETAAAWASAKGIVTGTGDGKFSPDSAITRQDLAVMLWRYTKYKGVDVTVGASASLEFSDAATVSEYALPAVKWACGKGLLKGNDEGKLLPLGSASRAETAMILQRFAAK